jgi:hypothetical protein
MTLQLLSAFERIHFERSILETLVRAARVPGWEKRYRELLEDAPLRAKNHALFAPVYERLQHAANAEEVLLEFLKALPTQGRPN